MAKVKNEPVENTEIEILEFEGTPVMFGKRELIVPPLSISVLHKSGFYKLQNQLIDAQNSNDPEAIGELTIKVLDFVFLAVIKNYPKETKEQTVELITTRQLKELIPALIDVQEGWDKAKNV